MHEGNVQQPPIPLTDIKRRMAAVAPQVQDAVGQVIASGQYLSGVWLERFESAFADYCGVAHAVGVANGTDALELALRASGCMDGDEVVTVANAGGYATTAIFHCGAKPVYADCDPHTFLMTEETFGHAITPTTRAVIVTHLYGLMADMPSIMELAHSRGITVIEDCAQAHGAAINGKKAGSWGTLGCYSFYPTKNLGALGDAGCIITANAAMAARVRSLRQYGWRDEKYYVPQDIGRNSRMDEIQAAVLVSQLPFLDGWNAKRRHIVQRYRDALASQAIRFQQTDGGDQFVAHLCVARVRGRDALLQALAQVQIAAAIHYPLADYDQPAVIARIGKYLPLPHTQAILPEIISFPCFPELSDEEVDRVIIAVQKHIATQVAA